MYTSVEPGTRFTGLESEETMVGVFRRHTGDPLNGAVVTTLRLRIKTLEEKNRELTELLERAYGVIAQT